MRCITAFETWRKNRHGPQQPGLDADLELSCRSCCNRLVSTDRLLVGRLPYIVNRGDDHLRMFGWNFVAAVDNDLFAMGRETSQFRL